MRKTLKFSITLVLAVAMILSAAIIVSAEAASCGDGLTWEYIADTQTLVISGSGTMTEYNRAANFPWHAHRSDIKTIVLPEGLKNIPAQAFLSCTALEEINIPNSVTTIGSYAFSGCSVATAINFGSGVETVATNAFNSCNVNAIVSATSVEDWVAIEFEASSANPLYRTHALYVDGAIVTDVVLPETVSSIGSYAFYSNTALESITIPASVTSIGTSAFLGCSKEMVLTVYDGTYALNYVKANNVKYQINRDDATASGDAGTLMKWYFYEDTNTLVIEGAGSMTNFLYSSRVPWKDYRANIQNVVIAEGVESIGMNSFAATTNLTSIVLPNSVKTIFNYAFSSCSNLAEITLGTGLTDISSNAFSGCKKLAKVNVPSAGDWCEIKFASSTASPVYVSHALYLDGNLLTNVVVPEGVVSINDYAFYSNSTVESIILADSVETIGAYSFLACSSLHTFSAGSGLKSVGETSFSGCNNLVTVNTTDVGAWAAADFATTTANPTSKSHTLYVNGVLANELIIPEGTTKLGANAFYAVLCNKSITIPSTIETYELTTFGFNTQAKTVYGTPGTLAEQIAAKKTSAPAKFVDVATKAPVAVTAISIPAEMDLFTGDKAVLAAILEPDTAFEDLTWISADEDVVTVKKGVVTAVAEGTAVVTVKASNGVTATCTINVEDKAVNVAGVVLDITKATVTAGDELTLVATINPANADNQEIIWSTSNEFAATVEDGVVTAVAEGTAIITATTAEGGYTATCVVTVLEAALPPVIEVTGITLSADTAELAPSETLTLVATVTPADATDATVTWTSDNTSVATVANGVVTALKDGKATITATAGAFSATCVVTVETPYISVESIEIESYELELIIGDEYDFVVTFNPTNATNKELYFENTNPDVVEVDEVTGHLVAVGIGKAVITIYPLDNEDAYVDCEVVVTAGNAVEGVALNKTSASLNTGDTTTLTVTFTPDNATNKNVTWTTSNAAVATVDNGVVTAIGSGVATITVTSEDGGFTATCKVIVTTGNETPPIEW